MVQLAADIIIPDEEGQVLLIKRSKYPFEGKWILPGGKLEEDEKIEETAVREAKEETNLDIEIDELLGVYSEPGRDPRGRYVSTAFITKPVKRKKVKTNREASKARWIDPKKVEEKEMGFDHWQMIQDYLEKK